MKALICFFRGHVFQRVRGNHKVRLYFCDRCGVPDKSITIPGIDKDQ